MKAGLHEYSREILKGFIYQMQGIRENARIMAQSGGVDSNNHSAVNLYITPENVAYLDGVERFLNRVDKEKFTGQQEEQLVSDLLAFQSNPVAYARKNRIMQPGANGSSRRVNDWEFPLERKSALRNRHLFSGFTSELHSMLQQYGNNLSPADRKYLQHTIDANRKIQNLELRAIQRMKKGENPGTRLKVITTAGGGVEIVGTHQDAFQTSEHGCWSCSMAMLLQSRGVDGLTQEEIRAFRPNQFIEKDNQTDKIAMEAMNKDVPNKITEMGEIAILLAPDSAVREMEILPYDSTLPISEKDYIDRASKKLSAQIMRAIEVDKSPVSLRRMDHYITIVGVAFAVSFVFSQRLKDHKYAKACLNVIAILLFITGTLLTIQLLSGEKRESTIPSSEVIQFTPEQITEMTPEQFKDLQEMVRNRQTESVKEDSNLRTTMTLTGEDTKEEMSKLDQFLQENIGNEKNPSVFRKFIMFCNYWSPLLLTLAISLTYHTRTVVEGHRKKKGAKA